MRVDASHKSWIVVTVTLLVLATGAYVPYHLTHSLNGPRGSTWPGLAYGVVAILLMIYATALGLRRRWRSRQLGRAETWLKGHIWLGLLAYPLMFFHAGFRFGGAVTVVLVVLFTLVVATGIYGLVVQHVVPRLMTVQVPNETPFDQVPTYLGRMREEARRDVADVCGPLPGMEAPADKKQKAKEPAEGSEPLRDFYLQEVAAYLDTGRGRLAAVPSRQAVFTHVRTLSGPAVHETLARVEALCEERRTLAIQTSLHRWLHEWLLYHVALAAALMVLSVVHAISAVYY